ncbi:LexA family transcriptional regulator [Candidatus Gracilibacteria bacterium]|nr:LexA family transcriptional regulator [Candidatus Gracilibacteria bacterium]
MRPDNNYQNKLDTLRDFFRGGGFYQSLEQMSELLNYANSAGAKRFFQKLVELDLLKMENRGYIPTDKLIGYPLFESVRAGLPFTPETQPTSQMDLEKYLIEHPASTYFVKVKGDSMRDAGIIEGDIVILDRSLRPNSGNIVIASLDGDVTLKYFEKKGEIIHLIPANPDYTTIVVNGPCEILGVVSGSVRKYH